MEITYEKIDSFGYLKAELYNNFYVQAIDPASKFISIASYVGTNTVLLPSFNDQIGIQIDPKIVAPIIKDQNE
jgi:hypothetical protein